MELIVDRPVRALLSVKGNVQGVGYRVIVRQIAQRKNIKGKVRNLDDGSVEVYCEGNTKELVKDFIEDIYIQPEYPGDIHAIHVDNIGELWEDEEGFETEEGYIPLEAEMERFEIDYDNGAMTPFEKINLMRLETGSLMMYGVNQGLITTHSDFLELEGKYHTVSKKLEKLESIDKNLSKLADGIETIVKEFVSNRKETKD